MMQKNTFFSFILIFLSIFYVQNTHAQEYGRPFITNYSAKTYKAHIQNWSVAQDSRGVMYFGNTDGLLIYNGSSWSTYILPGKETVRAVRVSEDDKVYIGSVNTFGYLNIEPDGSYKYIALDKLIPNKDSLDIEDIWDIIFYKDEVIFRSYNQLFIYKNKQIKILKTKHRIFSYFQHNGVPYFWETRPGFLKYENGKLTEIEADPPFNKISVRAAGQFDDKRQLFVTSTNGLYLYDVENNKSERFESELNPTIEKVGVYTMAKIDENHFAIGTAELGAFVMNKEGKIVQTINQTKGLQNDEIFSIFPDRQKNIWTAMNNGISKTEFGNPISFWNTDDGLLGAVEAITRFNNKLYISTHRGVFMLEDNKIVRIYDNSEQCWTLYNFKIPNTDQQILLSGNSSGLYTIEDKTFTQSIRGLTVFELYQSKKTPELLYIAHGRGLATAKYKDGKFTEIHDYKEINDNVRSVAEDKDGSVWLGTFRHGAIRLQLNDTLGIDSLKYYKEENGFPGLKNILTYHYNNKVLFGTENGLFHYDKESDKMVPDDLLGNYHKENKVDVFSFIQTPKNEIWYSGLNNEISKIAYGTPTEKDYSWIYTPFYRIPEMYTLAFYVDQQSIAWIGGSEGIFKFDPKEYVSPKAQFYALLNYVSIGSDSAIFKGNFVNSETNKFLTTQPSDKQYIIDYKNNSMLFKYSSTNFTNEQLNEFQVKLEGFSDEWSNWTTQAFKEYTNLSPGKYTFFVRTKNKDQISKESSFSFKINAPWYKTYWAYAVYVILAGLLFYIALKLNLRRLEIANQKLEKIIDERTAEIREQNNAILQQNAEISQQKEEILAQAEQLEFTNQELEKLSIVARETDNAIVIMDAVGNFEWVNEAFERLYGYTLEEWSQKFGSNIYSSSTNEQIKEVINEVIDSKQSGIYESFTISASGEKIWVQTTVTPILDYNDEVEKLIAIDSDIRLLKNAEQEIFQQNEEILTQKEKLEQQNEEISTQSRILEITNRNLNSSINYAKTIQNSILPLKETMDKYFHSFIIYRPKDIVSGDFYWFAHVEHPTTKKELTFVAAVDCTGHGVPGAFMSIISSRMLNEIVNVKHITEPSEILSILNSMIEKALKQDVSENKDGLDIALCSLEKTNQNKTLVKFSGAKRPLYYFKKDGTKIEEVKGTRRSIGGLINFTKIEFQQKEIILNSEDLLYLATDGFIDQNNKERKRLGSRKLIAYLEKITKLQLEEQKRALEQELEKHQQKEEQRDDITLFGIKIK